MSNGNELPDSLVQGTQIVYQPDYVDPNKFGYPGGVEPGFIWSGPTEDGSYYCRYWQCYMGKIQWQLRTLSNSELTPASVLKVRDTVPQQWVDWAIDEIKSYYEEREA